VFYPPDSFTDKLESTFKGRLRCRWSRQRAAWLIEQKVRRGIFPGSDKGAKAGWDETSDRYVQHRDGVIEIMEVRTGTLMDCPRCKHEVKVPYGYTGQLVCKYCQLQGRRPNIVVAFIPLGDQLITYLLGIDPDNPISEDLAADVDRRNAALVAEMENDAIRPTEAAFEDDYRRIRGIPTAHLSGRTAMWKDKD
jgi:hypothetical protein